MNLYPIPSPAPSEYLGPERGFFLVSEESSLFPVSINQVDNMKQQNTVNTLQNKRTIKLIGLS